MDTVTHDVLVVGGGPVGLLTAAELGRRGIDVGLVERRTERLHHPRALGIHARTMELFRQLGWADEIRGAGGLPVERWHTFGYTTRLVEPDIGAIDLFADGPRLDRARDLSPELVAWCAQDALESLLRAKVDVLPTVSVRTGVRVSAVEPRDDHVAAVLDDGGRVHARYLVGADGARSTVRAGAGIGFDTSGPLGHQIGARFRGDLLRWAGDRRHVLWWIVNPDTNGAFIAYDGDQRWIYSWAYDPARDQPSDFTPQRCAAVIRAAIGDPDADVEVDGVYPWAIESAVADRFRAGRMFLAGDAAHCFSPSGGFGMNTGLQDAQNLAWKLAMVLRDEAGEGLLDTYEPERRTVARDNAEQTLTNTINSARVGWAMTDPDMLARIEGPDGAAVRARIAEAIPLQQDQYWSYGQQFGHVYSSSAVVPDGTTAEPSTVGEYRPTATPGAHAPHVTLRHDGVDLSTVDVLHTGLVLLTDSDGAAAWRAAVDRAPAPVALYVIGPDGDLTDRTGTWAERYGLDRGGAVLVRPDGHVGYRARSAPADPAAALTNAVERILAR